MDEALPSGAPSAGVGVTPAETHKNVKNLPHDFPVRHLRSKSNLSNKSPAAGMFVRT